MTSLFLKVLCVVTPIFMVIFLVMVWYDMYRKNQGAQLHSDHDERFDVEDDTAVNTSTSEVPSTEETTSAQDEEPSSQEQQQSPEPEQQQQESPFADVMNLFEPVKVWDIKNDVDEDVPIIAEEEAKEKDDSNVPFTKRYQSRPAEEQQPQQSPDEPCFVDSSNIQQIVAEQKEKILNEKNETTSDTNTGTPPPPRNNQEKHDDDDSSLEVQYQRKALPVPQNSLWNMCGNDTQSELENPKDTNIVCEVEGEDSNVQEQEPVPEPKPNTSAPQQKDNDRF